MDILSVVPKNLGSYLFGCLSRLTRPRCLVKYAKRQFVRMYGIDMSEVTKDVDSYRSLEDLFTRRLVGNARTIGESRLVAPCDGLISQMGRIENSTLLQVKGKYYSLKKLLKGYSYDRNASVFDRLDRYVTIYLSPSNYHRVHSPVTGKVCGIYAVCGKLWPVNDRYVKKISDLFSENERMIFEILVSGKYRVYVVMVGALNVGRIQESVTGKKLHTNEIFRRKDSFILPKTGIDIKKGEELGVFKLGSTVVTIFEKAMLQDDDLKSMINEKIKLGTDLI